MTWKAPHFGIRQKLTSKITAFECPFRFRDEMLEGAFKMIRHDHLFEPSGDKAVKRDKFESESAGGIFGILFNKLVLKNYLRNLLIRRNRMIKEVAESDRWKIILKS